MKNRRKNKKSGTMPVADCPICLEYLDYDRDYDDELFPADKRLETIRIGCSCESFRKCNLCGKLYFHEDWPEGPGNTGGFKTLRRLQAPLEDYVRQVIDGESPQAEFARDFLKDHEKFNDKDWNIIEAAFDYAEKQRKLSEVLPMLLPLLSHTAERVRFFAIRRLVRCSAAKTSLNETLPIIEATLSDESARIRQAGAEYLTGVFARTGKWDPVKGFLSSPETEVLNGALSALFHAARETGPGFSARKTNDLSPIIPELNDLLRKKDGHLREKVTSIIKEAQAS